MSAAENNSQFSLDRYNREVGWQVETGTIAEKIDKESTG